MGTLGTPWPAPPSLSSMALQPLPGLCASAAPPFPGLEDKTQRSHRRNLSITHHRARGSAQPLPRTGVPIKSSMRRRLL